MDKLFTRSISSSRDTTSLDLISDKSVSLTLLESSVDNETETRSLVSRLIVKKNMELMGRMVRVRDTQGEEVLRVDSRGVRWDYETRKSKILFLFVELVKISWQHILHDWMQLCKQSKLSPGRETLSSSTHQQGKHCYLQWSEWFVTIVSVISRWRETRALIWVLQVIIYSCAPLTTSTSRPGKARSSWPPARCWCLDYQHWTPPLMRTRGDNTTTGLE